MDPIEIQQMKAQAREEKARKKVPFGVVVVGSNVCFTAFENPSRNSSGQLA